MFKGLTEEVASAAPDFAEVASLGFLAKVFLGVLGSSLEASLPVAVLFSFVVVLGGMTSALHLVSFHFLNLTEVFI